MTKKKVTATSSMINQNGVRFLPSTTKYLYLNTFVIKIQVENLKLYKICANKKRRKPGRLGLHNFAVVNSDIAVILIYFV